MRCRVWGLGFRASSSSPPIPTYSRKNGASAMADRGDAGRAVPGVWPGSPVGKLFLFTQEGLDLEPSGRSAKKFPTSNAAAQRILNPNPEPSPQLMQLACSGAGVQCSCSFLRETMPFPGFGVQAFGIQVIVGISLSPQP